jgi:hypothetical protein
MYMTLHTANLIGPGDLFWSANINIAYQNDRRASREIMKKQWRVTFSLEGRVKGGNYSRITIILNGAGNL